MIRDTAIFLKNEWGISESLLDQAASCEKAIGEKEQNLLSISRLNVLKVLKAFREANVKEAHLQPSFGYGYFDSGRGALERAFAEIFKTEDALVRPQFVSGTHVLRCALFGLLRPGDELLVIPAKPYDTLHPLFGLKPASGSLTEWGVSIRLAETEEVCRENFSLGAKTKVAFIQRSKGYAWQNSLSIKTIEAIILQLKTLKSSMKVVVDNCYGEFVEEKEPCEVGADLAAGSLIKNPGGGLAVSGGYLAGKTDAIKQASVQLTSAGLGKEVGATLGTIRHFFMGLFLAPTAVGEALRTSLFAAKLFQTLGFEVLPGPEDERTDTIQAVRLGSLDRVLAFARGIQSAGPLDQEAIPEGAPMAGYDEHILMASGSFIQGGSLELSCDAPLREPYAVYLQGGLSSAHGKLGVLLAAQNVLKKEGF